MRSVGTDKERGTKPVKDKKREFDSNGLHVGHGYSSHDLNSAAAVAVKPVGAMPLGSDNPELRNLKYVPAGSPSALDTSRVSSTSASGARRNLMGSFNLSLNDSLNKSTGGKVVADLGGQQSAGEQVEAENWEQLRNGGARQSSSADAGAEELVSEVNPADIAIGSGGIIISDRLAASLGAEQRTAAAAQTSPTEGREDDARDEYGYGGLSDGADENGNGEQRDDDGEDEQESDGQRDDDGEDEDERDEQRDDDWREDEDEEESEERSDDDSASDDDQPVDYATRQREKQIGDDDALALSSDDEQVLVEQPKKMRKKDWKPDIKCYVREPPNGHFTITEPERKGEKGLQWMTKPPSVEEYDALCTHIAGWPRAEPNIVATFPAKKGWPTIDKPLNSLSKQERKYLEEKEREHIVKAWKYIFQDELFEKIARYSNQKKDHKFKCRIQLIKQSGKKPTKRQYWKSKPYTAKEIQAFVAIRLLAGKRV